MKVVHLSVADIKGGAARAAYRLHQGLARAGLDSSMIVAEKYSDDGRVQAPIDDHLGYLERRLHFRQLSPRFWRYFRSRPPGLSPFTAPRVSRNRDLIEKLPDIDLINLHWIAHYIDLPSFIARSSVPLVWTLHDMNAFTGGCHYALDCTRFKEKCGACFQLGSRDCEDISRKIWWTKVKAYRQKTAPLLHLVAPSRWLANEAAASSLLQDLPIVTIPNGLDTSLFRPLNKQAARASLGVPDESRVILFTAESINSRRKGLNTLLQALPGAAASPEHLLLSLGSGTIEQELPMPTMSLGYLKEEKQLALAYSAADLFIIPSLQDNLPNTVLEALACGTPVVGFDVGGIPDMVRPGITGELVPAGEAEQLWQTAFALLDDEATRLEMGRNGRRIAENEYSLAVQAERYIQLYQQLLARPWLAS